MRKQPCADISVLAGNIVAMRAEAQAPALSTGSVNPSTVRVAVTDINGVTVPLDETVSYNWDESAVIIDTRWEIPDSQPGGTYTVTFDIDGNLVGATERYIRVHARTLSNVPA